MARLFNRKVNVVVDSVLVSELRVTFKVKKTLRKEPNTCEVTITNASQSTRASMKSKGAIVIVQAGYEGFLEQIFTGDARVIEHKKDNADWITSVQCGDGERAYNHKRISKSYASGTKIANILTDVVKTLGVDPGNAINSVGEIVENLPGGYVAHGRAGAELDRLLIGRGFEWSVQDGRLQLLKTGKTTNVLTVLTPDTGLIGSPEYGSPDKKGGAGFLKVKTLLQPQIRPGGKVRIKTSSVDGLFRAEAVTHEGDTAGGAWYTDLELSPISE